MAKIKLNESDLKQLIEKVLSEEIKEGSFNELYKRVQKIASQLNVGQNSVKVTVEYGYNGKHILVHYTSPNWQSNYNNGTSDEEMYALIKKYGSYIKRIFLPLRDFYQKGFQGFKDTFSKGLKTVDVYVNCFIKKIHVESNPDYYFRNRHIQTKFNVVSYSEDDKSVIGTQETYKNDDLNIFNAYVYIKPRTIN